MDTPEPLEAALKRLGAALEKLEAASQGRIKGKAQCVNLEEELAILEDDRSRLATERDGALARALALASAADEVAGRLQSASAAVKAVLSAIESEA